MLGFSAGVANFNPTPFNGQHKITMMGATPLEPYLKVIFGSWSLTIGRFIFKAWKMKEASQSSFFGKSQQADIMISMVQPISVFVERETA